MQRPVNQQWKRTIPRMEMTCPAHSQTIHFQSLASGSSGNAYLLSFAGTTILIDCGVGVRQITAAVNDLPDDAAGIDALVISHEHSDHIRSLGAFVRKNVPVATMSGTANALGLASQHWMQLRAFEEQPIGSITIRPIPTSHDAAEPIGLIITAGGANIGILTDLGRVSTDMADYAADCSLLVLESNHDGEMLRNGPYPDHLKRRVAGPNGHLSNQQAADFISEIVSADSGPDEIWLGHLSATNNTPVLASAATTKILAKLGVSIPISVLPRGGTGPVWSGTARRTRQLAFLTD